MSQSGYTPIQLYRSATPAAAPSAGNLSDGELAINTDDGKLYYKDSGGVVQVMASKAAAAGSFVTLSASGHVTFEGVTSTGATGTGNLVFSASPTFTGTLSAAAISASSTVTGSALIPSSSTVPTNGMYLPTANTIGISANSAKVLDISATGLAITGSTSTTADITVGTGNGISTAGLATAGSGARLAVARQSNPALLVTRLTDDGTLVEFYKSDGTLRGSISISGTNTAYNTTSDGTLKNKFGPADVSVSRQIIMNSPIVEYAFKDDPTQKHHIGVIAQELYDSGFHGAVNVGGERTDEEGRSFYEPWAVDKTAYQFHLVLLAQDHESRIAALEAKLGMNQNVGM